MAPVADDVEATAGEADPVLAVEDALSEFPADRMLVLGLVLALLFLIAALVLWV